MVSHTKIIRAFDTCAERTLAKAQPAVVSWAENRVDVFIRGKDNAVWHRSAEDEIWAPWESLGGSIAGNVEAMSWEPGRLELFARGFNNDVLFKWFWEGRWTDWRSLGGSITSDISATIWRDYRTFVLVARGTNNTVVAYATSTGSWITLSGDFLGSPKVLSSSDHRIDFFMRGLDNAVYQKANVGLWLPPGELEWNRLGGNATSDIAVVSKRQDTLSLFFQGKDNALWHKYWSGTSWQPSAEKWNRLGGILVSKPSVNTFSDEGINVFVQGTDNALWRKTWNGTSWMSWKSYGGKIVSPPVAIQGRNAVYAIAPNGTLLQYRYSNPVV